ncbi:hypothetical protein [Pseudoclavibacter sp. VKM Ac-2888]|uniref:hypothetical protein n=1 Tax=Pseudoclavibacter sp. VKM Ac-2888 TaxID=2783830 RepID=UPI00188AC81F|nr:hypothetical protein [Pseudoclavibacter sp. VKM Ac-2888]MBF4549423.1 hypothetical protein [Pseudoclavibacter sp. VKM Ac-2888]
MTGTSTLPSHAGLERAEGHAPFSDTVIRDIQDLFGIAHDADPVEALRIRLQRPTLDRPAPADDLDRLDAFARQFGSVALSGRTARSLIDEVRAARAAIPEAVECGVLSTIHGRISGPVAREEAQQWDDDSAHHHLVERYGPGEWRRPVGDLDAPSDQAPGTAELTA